MRITPTLRPRYPGQYLVRSMRDMLLGVTDLGASAPDLAIARVPGRYLVLAKHPDLVREVLITQAKSLHKGRGLQRTRFVLGDGLLTAEGDVHLRQRRLVQPAFHRERIARYADTMVACTERATADWHHGQRLDAAQAMHHLTLDIVARTLFDADLRGRAAALGAALTAVMDTFTVMLILVGDRLYDMPLPRMRRAKRALPVLNEAIHALIREHRATGEDRGDLLSMLLAARDTEGDGGGMSDEQIRDEVMTLVLAGHETTANALAWTWWFLAHHPDVESRLYAELDAVLGDVDVLSMAHLPSLPYTRAVLAESMRLRPPVYATSREVVGDFALNGIRFPLGTQVMVSQWVTQRDPRWWDAPERFDPSRWLDGREAGRHKFAYFPFIAGTRVCVGEQFAWTEGVLLLASIARRWRLKLTVPPSAVGHYAAVTLRPDPGVPVELERRKR